MFGSIKKIFIILCFGGLLATQWKLLNKGRCIARPKFIGLNPGGLHHGLCYHSVMVSSDRYCGYGNTIWWSLK